MTDIKSIDVQTAAKGLQDNTFTLIDIREPDEYARVHIQDAIHRPLSKMDGTKIEIPTGQKVVFHCRTGMRTKVNFDTLAASVDGTVHVLDGGIEAWKNAGLPVIANKSAPIEIMRQVQITAGSLVLIGVILGTFVNPNFYALSGFIGAGLVFAGASGWCGMGMLLGAMPWNKSVATA